MVFTNPFSCNLLIVSKVVRLIVQLIKSKVTYFEPVMQNGNYTCSTLSHSVFDFLGFDLSEFDLFELDILKFDLFTIPQLAREWFHDDRKFNIFVSKDNFTFKEMSEKHANNCSRRE